MTAVHVTNRAGYRDALGIKTQYSATDSATLISLVEKTLAVDNPKACALVKKKKVHFDSIYQGWLVLAPEKSEQAKAAVDVITMALADAIDYYSWMEDNEVVSMRFSKRTRSEENMDTQRYLGAAATGSQSSYGTANFADDNTVVFTDNLKSPNLTLFQCPCLFILQIAGR
jgi:hypothetical protein